MGKRIKREIIVIIKRKTIINYRIRHTLCCGARPGNRTNTASSYNYYVQQYRTEVYGDRVLLDTYPYVQRIHNTATYRPDIRITWRRRI